MAAAPLTPCGPSARQPRAQPAAGCGGSGSGCHGGAEGSVWGAGVRRVTSGWRSVAILPSKPFRNAAPHKDLAAIPGRRAAQRDGERQRSRCHLAQLSAASLGTPSAGITAGTSLLSHPPHSLAAPRWFTTKTQHSSSRALPTRLALGAPHPFAACTWAPSSLRPSASSHPKSQP